VLKCKEKRLDNHESYCSTAYFVLKCKEKGFIITKLILNKDIQEMRFSIKYLERHKNEKYSRNNGREKSTGKLVKIGYPNTLLNSFLGENRCEYKSTRTSHIKYEVQQTQEFTPGKPPQFFFEI